MTVEMTVEFRGWLAAAGDKARPLPRTLPPPSLRGRAAMRLYVPDRQPEARPTGNL